MNRKAILTLVTESPLHPGTGQNVGAIDLPVQRERHTQFPYVPSSSLKGALRSALNLDEEKKKAIFGAELHSDAHFAGAVSFSDTKLLAFPVRTLTGVFGWATSPIILSRLQRDFDLLGVEFDYDIPTDISNTEVLVSESHKGHEKMIIEDLMLESKKNPIVDRFAEIIGSMCFSRDSHKTFKEKLAHDLFLLSEATFSHLLIYGTEVMTRNVLSDNKTSENMWSIELIPRDTLFYCLLIAGDSRNGSKFKSQDMLNDLSAELSKGYIQLGGNESIGLGWCATDLLLAEQIGKLG